MKLYLETLKTRYESLKTCHSRTYESRRRRQWTHGGQRIGYTRVSTVTQTLDQQNDALAKAGVSKTFSDNMSGARYDRPGLAALMDYIRDGDTVVVWKVDRLARNTLHILETVQGSAPGDLLTLTLGRASSRPSEF
jgi:predicted site-specific integrase-resolvase